VKRISSGSETGLARETNDVSRATDDEDGPFAHPAGDCQTNTVQE